jgi:membrane protease YdiL (CAAX protease family)
MAIFKTSFSEEILFRGFIAKRLIGYLGYLKGNIIQAIIFGIIHAALFAFITSNIIFLIIIFVVPSIGAYVSVYLNEKMANGSIIPGWISHGLANILSYGIIGFLI